MNVATLVGIYCMLVIFGTGKQVNKSDVPYVLGVSVYDRCSSRILAKPGTAMQIYIWELNSNIGKVSPMRIDRNVRMVVCCVCIRIRKSAAVKISASVRQPFCEGYVFFADVFCVFTGSYMDGKDDYVRYIHRVHVPCVFACR